MKIVNIESRGSMKIDRERRNERDLIQDQIAHSLSGYADWVRSEVVQRSAARIAVYEAGSHTEQLLQLWTALCLPHWNRVLVTDAPTSPAWRGIPLSQISDVCPEEIDLIVLSSRTYESEMAEVCRQRFPSVPRIAIWAPRLSDLHVKGHALKLRSAKEHYKRAMRLPADELPEEASRWSNLRSDMARFIEGTSSLTEAIGIAQEQCGFDHRTSYDSWREAAHLYLNALSYEHPTFRSVVGKFAESPVSLPQSIGIIDGVPLSNVSLCHSIAILTNLWFDPPSR